MNAGVYGQGKFTMPPMPTQQAVAGEEVASSADKLRQAVKLVVEVRADEKVRDAEVDTGLAFAAELLIKIAEGESVEDMLPQEAPMGQKIYRSTREMPGSVAPSYNAMSPEMQPHQIMAR